MSDVQTIILRDAVTTAINYLQRLPRVPATAVVIRELEEALARAGSEGTARLASGAAYTPVGELLLQALLRDQDLLVTTAVARGRADVLWQALAGDGLQLRVQSDDLPSSANVNVPGR